MSGPVRMVEITFLLTGAYNLFSVKKALVWKYRAGTELLNVNHCKC